jgi:hypothetical protein
MPLVTPQPRQFNGGWITPELVGTPEASRGDGANSIEAVTPESVARFMKKRNVRAVVEALPKWLPPLLIWYSTCP